MAKSEEMLQSIVGEFDRVYRRKLRVNSGKNKVSISDKATEQTTDFEKPYIVKRVQHQVE